MEYGTKKEPFLPILKSWQERLFTFINLLMYFEIILRK